MDYPENEQWQPGMDGECHKCRREKYCRRICRQFKDRVRRELIGVAAKMANEALEKKHAEEAEADDKLRVDHEHES